MIERFNGHIAEVLATTRFGVDWKAEQKVINRWPNFRGYSGKLPRVNDGALLFRRLRRCGRMAPLQSADTIERYVKVYNQHISQKALGHIPPLPRYTNGFERAVTRHR